ncbi:MAG: hypothetical protein R6U36_03700, partial [Candidatus Fermentibacteraceae bacterium]
YDYEFGYAHRWFGYNLTINNNTKIEPIYNLNTTTGVSDLKITLRNEENYQYIPNIVGKLQRRYVGEGAWRTVQMELTGDYGLFLYHIYEESVDYRLIFLNQDNQILETSNTLKFKCTDGLCELIYLISEDISTSTLDNLDISWSYDNVTGIITVDWNDITGENHSHVRRSAVSFVMGMLLERLTGGGP